jgi:hypothetical protein
VLGVGLYKLFRLSPSKLAFENDIAKHVDAEILAGANKPLVVIISLI